MFYATICIPLGGTLIHTVYPLTKAIYEGDSEAYREVRKVRTAKLSLNIC